MKFEMIKCLFVVLLMILLDHPVDAQRVINDENIRDKVQTELYFRSDIPHPQLNVAVNKGIVTIEGTVDNLLAKENAAEVALAVKGTTGLVDLIKVTPAYVTDNILLWQATQALLYDQAANAYTVMPKVKDGIVTLTGTVESWQEKDLCTAIIKKVKGVKGVENEIDVVYEPQRSDLELRNEIQAAIDNDVLLYHKTIQVTVKDGAVSLEGIVGSFEAREQAEKYAWTIGVKAVHVDQLSVHDWAQNPNFKSEDQPLRTDDQIETSIRNALKFDPRVNRYHIDVEVNHRIATLSGKVNSLGARRAAAADARNVLGVAFVTNLLDVVDQDLPPDDSLQQRIQAAIDWNPILDPGRIESEAWRGNVTLNGTVETQRDKRLAEDIVADLRGVVAVENNLLVVRTPVTSPVFHRSPWETYMPQPNRTPGLNEQTPKLSDEEIKTQVSYEFWWSPKVDEEDIDIKVDEGVVTLSGQVDTWREWQAAVENAFEGGAESVLNMLKVR